MKSPGYVNLINWISDIWYAVPEEMIANSFDACAISSNSSLSNVLKSIIDAGIENEFVVDDETEKVDMQDVDAFDTDVQMVPNIQYNQTQQQCYNQTQQQ
jgi:hypothetical protein